VSKLYQFLTAGQVPACASYVAPKYEFISFRWFSQALGGPARYVRFLRPVITYGDLLRHTAAFPDAEKCAGTGKTAGACLIAFQDTSPAPRPILYCSDTA